MLISRRRRRDSICKSVVFLVKIQMKNIRERINFFLCPNELRFQRPKDKIYRLSNPFFLRSNTENLRVLAKID